MKIRDSRAAVNGDFETQQMPSGGLDIIADDGRVLYSLKLIDGALEISGFGICKHEGKLLGEHLLVSPHYANKVSVSHKPHIPN